jgi:class 3 adenylate cyclase
VNSSRSQFLCKDAQTLHIRGMSASPQASVVFLKMQDFARRAASEQARLRAQLEAVVAVTVAEIVPANRVVLEAGDGVAVVVLRDPRGALRLAERALAAAAAGLPLSAGINYGAVQVSKGNGGMTGDGIAVAAAIAEFAAPSRLLASRTFRDALADVVPGFEATLTPAGTFTDPGLRSHELFGPDRGAPRRRRRRYAAASVVLALALLGGGIGARIAKEGRDPFVNSVTSKMQPYWQALVRKVDY